MNAYTYFLVEDEIPSSSTNATYAVKIRLDNRLDSLERIQEAVLTCDCKGWTQRAKEPRSCKHTKEREGILEDFIAENMARIKSGISAGDFHLWLPTSGRRENIDQAEAEIDALLGTLEDPEKISGAISRIWQFGEQEKALEMIMTIRQRLKDTTETVEALFELVGA